MKKVILATMLVFILIISSVTLFACDDLEQALNNLENDNNPANPVDPVNPVDPANPVEEEFIYEKDGESTIYFGSYPQSQEKDTTICAALNQKAGALPTAENKNGWTDYEYYCGGVVTSYMWYQDIEYNGAKYRGVYFTEYRPVAIDRDFTEWDSILDDDSLTEKYTSQSYFGFEKANVYWFKFEKIKWSILNTKDGNVLISSILSIDAQEYEPSTKNDEYEHNGGTGYANNYALSHIRKWLNYNFYSTAFSAKQKEIIQTIEVDNSIESYGTANTHWAGASNDKLICDNTNDKIFLLSFGEVETYYPQYADRAANGSDYAKSQGLFTLHYEDYLGGLSLDEDGMVSDTWWITRANNQVFYDGHWASEGREFTWYGIRPACWIKL
ncbi:MAG: DUF6273 domain-containing protein [Clostridia bacterium]|nr:DUF6273 domain-containing protein [Clostridia bacterium]